MRKILTSLFLVLLSGMAYPGDDICVSGISGIYSVKTSDYSAIINHQASNRQIMHVRFNNRQAYEYAMFFDNGSGDIKILRGNLSQNACDEGNIYINGLTNEFEYEITRKCPSRERRTRFDVKSLPLNYVTNQQEASELLKLHRQINLTMNHYLQAEIEKQPLGQYPIRRLK